MLYTELLLRKENCGSFTDLKTLATKLMKNFLQIFTDYRYIQIFVLGIFSGMPLMLLYVTLFTWLTEAKIDVAVVTTFALARIFYSLKFLWSPIVDQVKIPVLSKIGHRKSWMIVCAGAITFILIAMSKLDPAISLSEIYMLIMLLGAASATFDIVFDAFRIEKLEPELQTIGAANAIFGYRIGCLIAGAGALYFADIYGWKNTFFAISMLYVAVIFYVLSCKETPVKREEFNAFSLHSWRVMTIDPFTDFFKRQGAALILAAVIFFKLGEAMFGVVTTPFYLELGFTKSEIASVSKVFGLFATIIGTYAGGYIMYRFGSFKGMIIAGIIQSITNAAFIWLNHMGHDIGAFMIAIAIDNIAGGIGNSALVGYLSTLCNRQFSATQYALLSSASGLFSHSVVIYGGSLVKLIGWDLYFLITIILAIPGIWLLIKLQKKYG